MATTSKISLGNGSTVEMTRNEGVPDAIWNDVVKFVKENQKAVKANPQIVKLLSEHPEQVPMLMKFTNDSDSIKNFLQSQVLAANVSQDGQQEKMQQLQEDPELKPMFDDIKANGPDVLMKYLQDENIMRKVRELATVPPHTMVGLKKIRVDFDFGIRSEILKSRAISATFSFHGRKVEMYGSTVFESLNDMPVSSALS